MLPMPRLSIAGALLQQNRHLSRICQVHRQELGICPLINNRMSPDLKVGNMLVLHLGRRQKG